MRTESNLPALFSYYLLQSQLSQPVSQLQDSQFGQSEQVQDALFEIEFCDMTKGHDNNVIIIIRFLIIKLI